MLYLYTVKSLKEHVLEEQISTDLYVQQQISTDLYVQQQISTDLYVQ